jgi:divalent metal cation (Fe/Co/Zn/Cd) transporter
MTNAMAQSISRTIDPASRQRERSILFAGLSDMAIILAALIAAVWGNSLMMAAEALRGLLLVIMEMLLLVLLRRIHRGRTHGFDYGAGKLEQFGNLAIGTAMGLGGLWVGGTAAFRWWNPPEQATAGLSFAVLVGVVNVVQNGMALVGLWRAGRDGTSLIMVGQVRTRLAKLISSVIVFAALCINALLGDKVGGLLAEVLGSGFVALIMLQLAVEMWRHALPSLLDRTLDESRQQAINRVLAQHFDGYDELQSVRSRLSGNMALVEVVLGFEPQRPIGEIQIVIDRVAKDVGDLIPGALVSIIPVALQHHRAA